MGVHEACRNTADAFVINFEPDVCLTPTDGLPDTPVPYNIIGFFNNDLNPSDDVYFTSNGAANNACVIAHVQGNEAGSNGGIHSGVNLGACRPKLGHTGTIYVNGLPLLPDSAEMDMNFEQPMGVRNCLGLICYAFRTDAGIVIAPSGTFQGTGPPIDLNPYLEDFTDEERTWAEMTTAERAHNVVNRGIGAIQFIGGTVEIASGATLFSAGTAATGTGAGSFAGIPAMVLGGTAVLHGFDNIQAGLRMVWTGEIVNTATQDAVDHVVYNGDPPDGITVGTWVDGTIGLGTGLGNSLAREGAENATLFILNNQDEFFSYIWDIGAKDLIETNLTILEDYTAPDDGSIDPPPDNGVVVSGSVAATAAPGDSTPLVLEPVSASEIEAMAAAGTIVSVEDNQLMPAVIDPTQDP